MYYISDCTALFQSSSILKSFHGIGLLIHSVKASVSHDDFSAVSEFYHCKIIIEYSISAR